MAVRRGPRASDHYAQISNVLLQDFALSSKARGLAAMLLSFPPGWQTTVSKLSKQLEGDGYEAVRTGFLELERRGYLVRVRQRLANGRMGDLDQWIFDDPRAAEAYRVQLEAETSAKPGSGNPILGVTSGNAASSQVRARIGFPDIGQSSTTKTEGRKTERKTGGEGSRVVEPSVTREPATSTTRKSTIPATPDQKLTAAGLASPSDRGRFREYLRTVKNARSTEAVIVAAAPEDLASQVNEWRRSLDVANEPDAEPVLCDHGHDVALGEHMCPLCDPARQPAATLAPAVVPEHDGAPMPEWLREALAADPALAVPGAFGAPDATTRGGVTPSLLVDVA